MTWRCVPSPDWQVSTLTGWHRMHYTWPLFWQPLLSADSGKCWPMYVLAKQRIWQVFFSPSRSIGQRFLKALHSTPVKEKLLKAISNHLSALFSLSLFSPSNYYHTILINYRILFILFIFVFLFRLFMQWSASVGTDIFVHTFLHTQYKLFKNKEKNYPRQIMLA